MEASMSWNRTVIGQVGMAVWIVLAAARAAFPQAPADTTAAPPEGWVVKSSIGLSLNQSSFNTAWAGDEVGTVSWIATSKSEASNLLAPWVDWHNGLLLQFGQTHQQDPDRSHWMAPLKSADKITYRGNLLFKISSFVDPFVAFDVDSRFYDQKTAAGTGGIEVTDRKLFTPTLFTESAGVARELSNNSYSRIVTRFGGALKQTVDRLATFDPVAASFDTRNRTDAGLEWFTQSRLAAKEDRTVFHSELRVFKNLATSEKDPQARNHWPAVDVDWQNTLTNKIYKWVGFDLFWQVLYDKQVNEVGQYKQTLGLAITYQLAGK
jgi:hypothetical protein